MATEGSGRVVVSYGRRVLIDIGDGEPRRCSIKGRRLRPLCGDRIEWQCSDHDEYQLTAVSARRNELLRHDVRNGARAIAANIDQLVIVVASQPPVSLETVDRYIAGAEILRMTPLILRNKSDLKTDSDSADDAPQDKLAAGWRELETLGYHCLDVSAVAAHGLDALRAALAGKVSAFVGPSGVGKSSLLDALDPELELRTQTLSEGSGEGRHTTTATRLYQIPVDSSGAATLEVLDSPGVRDFRLWPMPQRDVQNGFRDVLRFADQCRFPDCCHLHEPGCAVLAATASGEISQRRYDSYQTLATQLVSRDVP